MQCDLTPRREKERERNKKTKRYKRERAGAIAHVTYYTLFSTISLEIASTRSNCRAPVVFVQHFLESTELPRILTVDVR